MGDVPELRAIDPPVATDDEVPRHRAARTRNVVQGSDVAGTFTAVGTTVKDLRARNEVFGSAARTFAEYAVAAATNVVGGVFKPTTTTAEQPAAVPLAGLTALQALRDHG